MRWVPFFILAYIFGLAQTTMGKIITFDHLSLGPVGPDFVALMAVFIALNVRNVVDGMLAGWVLGTMLDLTTAGGAGLATRVGPMAIAYVLGVWVVYGLREAFYRDRAFPQILIGALFCFITHFIWCTVQSLLAWGDMSLGDYGALIIQMLLSAVYTALLMPLGYFMLSLTRSWLLTTAPSRSGRARR